MNRLFRFIRLTLSGGLLLLLPLAALAWLGAKALTVMHRISEPIAHLFSFTKIAGIGVKTLISIFLLLLICFLAGLLMRTQMARRIKNWIEENILVYIPGYSYLSALSADKFNAYENAGWKPASILFDDNEVICFVIDESENYYTLFMPSAPTPSSGTVCVRKKRLVRLLPFNVSEAILLIKKFGSGAAATVEELDKTHPLPAE